MIRSRLENYVLSCGGGSSLDCTEAESREEASDAVDRGRSLQSEARRERSSMKLSCVPVRAVFLISVEFDLDLIVRGFESTVARLCNAAMVAATNEPPRPSSRMFWFKMNGAYTNTADKRARK